MHNIHLDMDEKEVRDTLEALPHLTALDVSNKLARYNNIRYAIFYESHRFETRYYLPLVSTTSCGKKVFITAKSVLGWIWLV